MTKKEIDDFKSRFNGKGLIWLKKILEQKWKEPANKINLAYINDNNEVDAIVLLKKDIPKILESYKK